jgi:hypothetical protein
MKVRLTLHARARMDLVSIGRALSGPLLETRVSAAGGPLRSTARLQTSYLCRAFSHSADKPEIKEIAGVKFQVRGLACAIASVSGTVLQLEYMYCAIIW